MDWITINKTEGRGSAEVKVTAPTYRELVDRMTRLKISTLSKTAYVSIIQEKFTPIFELSKTKLIFINDVVEENINITSNIAWTATVSNDWITLSSYNGDGNSILTISVNESDTAERTGSVEFYNSGVLVGSITITYNLFYVEPTEIDLTNNITTTINITSNTNWSVETSDWITLSQTEGEGNATLTITADEIYNPSQNRSGYIKFYNGDNLLGEVVVTQSFVIEFRVDVERVDVTYNNAIINVSSNTNWSVQYNSDWFSVSPTNGSGDGSITVTAEKYNNEDRSDIIFFLINGDIVDSVRVYQTLIPENCFYIEPVEPLDEDDSWISIDRDKDGIGAEVYAGAHIYRYVDGEGWDYHFLGNTQSFGGILPKRKLYYREFLNNYMGFVFKVEVKIGGDIETLLRNEHHPYYPYNGYYLFSKRDWIGNSVIPQVVDASDLLLPAVYKNDTYKYIFRGETNLIKAPKIIGDELLSDYSNTFNDCPKLEELTVLVKNPPNLSYFGKNAGKNANKGIYYISPTATRIPEVPSNWEVRYYEDDL